VPRKRSSPRWERHGVRGRLSSLRTARLRAAIPALLPIGCALLLAAAPPLAAQVGDTLPGGSGESLSVVLLTVGPGEAIWEKFGHNAIWIRDPGTGTDVAYNWGMFEFAAEDFLPRLVKGEMLYWMAGYDAGATIAAYERARRDVYAQELFLTPGQKLELVRLLRETDTDQNRFYAYDYYLDNCSTRVRDALDQVLGGRVRAALGGLETELTWRDHARRILRTTLWAYLGMELALGSPTDRTITAWEEAFLPLRLMDRLRAVEVPDGSGGEVPLVVREVQLVDGGRPPTPDKPPSWMGWFLVAGALGGLLMALPAWTSPQGARGGLGRGAAVLAAGWSLVAGMAGLLLLLAWLFTDHTFWFRNENLLQTSPLSLLLVPALAASALGRPLPRWGSVVAGGVLGLSLLGFLAQALPGLDQVNGEIIAFALPMHLAVAWLALHARRHGSAAAS